MPPPQAIPTRSCDGCALCCKLGEIPDFKPYNAWCQFCSTHQGCDAYDARPAPCRDFYCHYLTSDLGEEWRPSTCGMVVSVHAGEPSRLTVSVDPDRPERWREEPYLAQIMHWSRQGAVTIMVGDAAYAAYPDRIEPLGTIDDAHTILITEQQTAQGTRYLATRVRKS